MPSVRFLGHSSFLISTTTGTTIITDPYGTNVPYTFPLISADIVLISHEHADHNAYWRVTGNPAIIKRTGDYISEFETPVKRTGEILTFQAIPSYHDRFVGKKKGINTIFIWYSDGIKFCHLGDIGHMLTDKEMALIGEVDVLFCPVGGGDTLSSTDAVLVTSQLKAKIIFPMHFKTIETELVSYLDEPVDNFIEKMGGAETLYSLATTVEANTLPDRRVVKILERG